MYHSPANEQVWSDMSMGKKKQTTEPARAGRQLSVNGENAASASLNARVATKKNVVLTTVLEMCFWDHQVREKDDSL